MEETQCRIQWVGIIHQACESLEAHRVWGVYCSRFPSAHHLLWFGDVSLLFQLQLSADLSLCWAGQVFYDPLVHSLGPQVGPQSMPELSHRLFSTAWSYLVIHCRVGVVWLSSGYCKLFLRCCSLYYSPAFWLHCPHQLSYLHMGSSEVRVRIKSPLQDFFLIGQFLRGYSYYPSLLIYTVSKLLLSSMSTN